jgi:lipopolysaccharide export system protein LptA
VTFNEEKLEAAGAEARYDPDAGRLRITGADAGGPPRVADEYITIEAQQSIDVTLAGRAMTAVGPVKTTLRSGPARGGRGRTASPATDPGEAPATRGAGASAPAPTVSRLPGLLNNDEPANVSADALEYEGGAGKAVYTGNASLWQGQTAIRANIITIDQDSGDLLAAGAARSSLVFDNAISIGSAAEIRYADAKRVISYLSLIPAAPVSGRGAAPASPAPAAPASPAPTAPASPALPAPAAIPVQARLSGPQGDLRADRLEVILAQAGNRVDRLEAYTNVYARVDVRVATGGRLTYYAEDERYVLVGASPVPVKVIDNCRETMGKTLTFFKTADRIIVDGNEEIRTQTKRGGPCAAVPAR